MFVINGSLVLITWVCCINAQFKQEYNRFSMLDLSIQTLFAMIAHLSVFLARIGATACCHSQVKTKFLFKCICPLDLRLPAVVQLGPQFQCCYCWVSVVFLSCLFKKKCSVARFIGPVLHEHFCIGIRSDRSNAGARTKI